MSRSNRGKKYDKMVGSRAQVMNGTVHHTSGGLTASKLMMNKWGRIVSVAKHRTAKKEKRLEKAGFFAKKGTFGYIKKSAKRGRKSAKKGRKSRKMRGGEEGDEEGYEEGDEDGDEEGDEEGDKYGLL